MYCTLKPSASARTSWGGDPYFEGSDPYLLRCVRHFRRTCPYHAGRAELSRGYRAPLIGPHDDRATKFKNARLYYENLVKGARVAIGRQMDTFFEREWENA
jgi:hypothetical protein